jgi:hypothetical protein
MALFVGVGRSGPKFFRKELIFGRFADPTTVIKTVHQELFFV